MIALSSPSFLLVLSLSAFAQSQIQRNPAPSNRNNSSSALSGIGQCARPIERKEFRELSDQERQSYIDATKCLRDPERSPSILSKQAKSPSIYDDFVYVHMIQVRANHGTSSFLPWHRRFLAIYEFMLRSKCGYSGALPYWDWTVDSQAPEKSELFSPKWFGGNGDPENQWCISDGQFQEWTAVYLEDRPAPCVQRNWRGRNGAMPTFHSDIEIEEILQLSKDSYNTFRKNVEVGPHGQVHVNIGGDMSGTSTSTNDPLFYLHHCNIDRLYAQWQKENPEIANTYEGPRQSDRDEVFDARPNDAVEMLSLYPNAPVREMFSTTYGDILCYTYSPGVLPDTIAPGIGSGSGSRSKRSLAKGFRTWREQQGLHRQPFNAYAQAAGDSLVDHGSPENEKTPDIYDRNDKYNLRYHEPIPEAFLRNSLGYNNKRVAEVRLTEQYFRDFIDYVNLAAGFISHTALVYVEKATGWRSCSEEEANLHASMRKMLCQAAHNLLGKLNVKAKDVVQVFDAIGDMLDHRNEGRRQGSARIARPTAYRGPYYM